MKRWYVYMVRCARGALYTGMSDDVTRRVATHNAGKGAKSVKALGLPVTLAYSEECVSRSAALKREHAIKKLPKESKEKMVMSM
jgi:putative endonuclease